jgi:hypothetical protein
MHMRKILALVAMTGSFAFALGMNCIPNVPNLFGGITGQLNGLLGQ